MHLDNGQGRAYCGRDCHQGTARCPGRISSLATGQVLYKYKTGGYVISSPADSAGNLLIGSSDGFLYDLAPGGSNGTLPTTSITAPAAGSVIANPGVKPVVAAGTAQAGSAAVTAVNVAVQMNGPAGQWWNAAKGTWQPGPAWNHAALSGSGGAINWTLRVPVPAQGSVLTFTARAAGGDGLVDQALVQRTVTVRPVTTGPHITLSAAEAALAAGIKVAGAGFRPGEHVRLSLPGHRLATVTAGPKGGFARTRVQVPSTFDFGLTVVTATGTASGRSATAPLYITGAWVDALVVVGSLNDSVSAYAEKTGKLVWTVTTGGPV